MNSIEEEFSLFLKSEDPYSRDNPIGHITGSCWILNRDKTEVLLTHHRKLGIWIPTGGHSEGERDPLEIALREGEEETGLTLTPYSKEPFYLDIHLIPEYKGTPEHKHYDYTYIFFPVNGEDFTISDESHNLKWIPLESIDEYTKEINVIKMRDLTMEIKWKTETTTY